MNILGIGISIVAAALGFCGAYLAILATRASRGWRERCDSLEASLESMRREMEMVASISAKTGQRVKRIENEYSGVADRVEVVELRRISHSFDEAIDSARRGADPGKLSQEFGLSRGEADLVARLHGRKKSA